MQKLMLYFLTTSRKLLKEYSTILNEKDYRSGVIAEALAHAGEDKIRVIDNRAECIEERKTML